MKRIAWVDIAKYICIMAVMLEHLESITDELSCFLSPFFVLAFFFVAGYTHRPGQRFGEFFEKKLRTLFVPWLIFSVLDIALSQLVSFSEHRSFVTELAWNFLQIRGQGDQIWFVAALFIAFIPFYFFIEWYNKKPQVGATRCVAFVALALVLFLVDVLYSNLMDGSRLPWGTTALPWHVEYIFQAMFYMTLGYMFKQRWEAAFDAANDIAGRFMLAAVYIIIVYAPYFIAIPEPVFRIFAVFIAPILGILLVVSLSKVIKPNRYILYVGQNTLIYFALHGKVFGFIEVMLRRFVPGVYSAVLSNTLVSNLFALAFAFVLSFILLIPTYIINRWLPFMVGRRRKAAACAQS